MKPSETAFSTVFFRWSFRAEVVSDVISCANVEQIGNNVPIKFGDFRLNRSLDIRLPHFVTNNDNDDADRRTL